MRWRAICERRFERVIGDRTGFVPLDSNTDQPFDGPPGPAVSPIAEQPPLRRQSRASGLRLPFSWAKSADEAESSASQAQMGAGKSWGAARGPWRGANTAHSKPKSGGGCVGEHFSYTQASPVRATSVAQPAATRWQSHRLHVHAATPETSPSSFSLVISRN